MMGEELDLEDLNLYLNSVPTHSPNYLNFIQLNQRKSEIFDQLTRNYVMSLNKLSPETPLICLLQEPYYYKQGNFFSPDFLYTDIYDKQPGCCARAAIWCPKLFNPRPVLQLMSRDVAAAAITIQNESFLIISIYNPPMETQLSN